MPRPASMAHERIKHTPGALAAPWLTAENGGPLAADLPRVARILGLPLELVQAAAAQVEPYTRVDGTPVWSIHLLGRALGVRRARGLTQRRQDQRKRERREAARQREAG